MNIVSVGSIDHGIHQGLSWQQGSWAQGLHLDISMVAWGMWIIISYFNIALLCSSGQTSTWTTAEAYNTYFNFVLSSKMDQGFQYVTLVATSTRCYGTPWIMAINQISVENRVFTVNMVTEGRRDQGYHNSWQRQQESCHISYNLTHMLPQI